MRLLACLLASLAHSAPEPWLLKADADGYSYDVEGWGRITVEGVCAVSPASVQCWRPAGQRDAALTHQVDAQLREPGAGSLRLEYRRPNLLLVSSQPNSTAEIARPLLPGESGRVDQQFFSQGLRSDGFQVRLLDWIPNPENKTATDLVMSVPIFTEAQRCRVRRGEHLTLGPCTLELGRLKHRPPSDARSGRSAAPPPEWELEYKLSGLPAGATIRLHPKLLDLAGKPLGEPGTARRLKIPDPRGPFRYVVTDAPIGTSSLGSWSIGCDPKEIGFVEFHPTYMRRVHFRGIALHPSADVRPPPTEAQ
ncbi:MAG TPA: hypothetical protein VKT78_10710 [Fimbriimonadaceae bacterium]|nr:hypothetical protein [Fimbriimonadaceae bacterium]